MNFSQSNLAFAGQTASLQNRGKESTAVPGATATRGSLNDESAVREALAIAIRNCEKSREVIAEEMTFLLGSSVSKRSLDSFTSEASDQHRFPAQYLRAFCVVTGDWSPLRCVIERSGLQVIGREEQNLLELGKNYLRQKRAASTISDLEAQLSGVRL